MVNRNKEVFQAIEDGDLGRVKEILKSGFHINVQDERGNSLLMKATQSEQTEIVQYLLTLNPDLNLYNNDGFTVFPIAENIEDKVVYNLLLEQCLNPNIKIFLIGYHAIPKTEKEDVKGAFINCYIVDTNLQNAKKRSLDLVEEQEWEILSTEEESELNWFDIKEEDERKQYVEQVIIDKEVLVIYTYGSEEIE